MKNAVKFVKNIHFSKPDVILRSIPRNAEIASFGDKYKTFLRTLPKITNTGEIQNHLNFPYGLFNSFPKETLSKIMEESFEIMKSKVVTARHTYIYNKNMRNYILNEIEFDVKALLQDMNDNGVPFNRGTYQILIELNCRRGEMETVKSIIKTMESEGIELEQKDKLQMITGYIIAGQPEKAEEIIKENNISENDRENLVSQARGYASLGDTTKVVSIINKMKENNLDLKPSIHTLYRLLAISNAPESDLEQITQLIPDDNPRERISALIHYLNRNGHFNKSLKFTEKHRHLLLERNTVFDLLTSFNSKFCPKNIYKSVLQLFSENLNLSQRNLFANLTFDEALIFSRTIVNDDNGNIILTSLQNKAISDKSVPSIKESLHFGIDYLRIRKLNLQLQFGFIPAMLQSGMVSNCEELLKLLPEFQNKLLPCALMYHLCRGNFSEYSHLVPLYKIRRHLGYVCGNYPMGIEIIRNVGFEELDTLAVEALKVFNRGVVNDILSSVILELVLNQSKSQNSDYIAKVIKLEQKFDVLFTANDIKRMKSADRENANVFDNFRIRNELVKSKSNESENVESDVD